MSYQEKPSTNQWSAEDRTRAVHLRYAIPGQYLGEFWRELESRCDQLRIPVAAGTTEFAYFEGPKLFAQVHDTKNVISGRTLGTTLDEFVRRVVGSMNPKLLDFRSCCIDIGFRDMASIPQSEAGEERPVTLLWKKRCLENFHKQIIAVSPNMQLQAEYFRTFHLRDSATYASKPRAVSGRLPSPADPGNPDSTKLGVYHSKAYNCDKERFAVLSGDYQPFAAPNLAALALTDSMICDVFAAGHDRASAVNGAPQRVKLELAWEANKRHLRAVAHHQKPTNGYAARKEVTFRLDVILVMLDRGAFVRNCEAKSRSRSTFTTAVGGPLLPLQDTQHFPYWILASSDVNEFVCTLACRFVKPLNYILSTNSNADASVQTNSFTSLEASIQ